MKWATSCAACAAFSKRSSRSSRGTTSRAARRSTPKFCASSPKWASRRTSPRRSSRSCPPAADHHASRAGSRSRSSPSACNVTGDRWLDKGGRVALVGPTGVGKTTALAKLAVRWVLRHGARSLALISADSRAHRRARPDPGARPDARRARLHRRQLRTRFRSCSNRSRKRASCSSTPRARASATRSSPTRMQQLAAAGGHELETALVLVRQHAGRRHRRNRHALRRPRTPRAACSRRWTKPRASAACSPCWRARELPISYVSEGQRVPEDLRPARALELVSQRRAARQDERRRRRRRPAETTIRRRGACPRVRCT